MPPFVNTKCVQCEHPNRYDLADLRKKDTSIDKVVYRGENEYDMKAEEFEVTCEHCGRKFKFKVTGGSNG